MSKILFSLSGGTGAASWLGASAFVSMQNTVLGPDTMLSGDFVIQAAFLVAAGGMLIYAGRIVGQWQAAQKQLISEVTKLSADNVKLTNRVSKLEGIVEQWSNRSRSRTLDMEKQA